MASLINNLSREWAEKEVNYKKIIENQQAEINKLKGKI